jgi:hypothetical protein
MVEVFIAVSGGFKRTFAKCIALREGPMSILSDCAGKRNQANAEI